MRYSSSMIDRNMRISALLWFFLHKILHASGTFISISYLRGKCRETNDKNVGGAIKRDVISTAFTCAVNKEARLQLYFQLCHLDRSLSAVSTVVFQGNEVESVWEVWWKQRLSENSTLEK